MGVEGKREGRRDGVEILKVKKNLLARGIFILQANLVMLEYFQ